MNCNSLFTKCFSAAAALCVLAQAHALELYTGPFLGEPVDPNLGMSFQIAGPIFGSYNLGVGSLLTSKIQVGVSGTYNNTYFFWPRLRGWEWDFRVNYAFRDFRHNGPFLGASVGYEFVETRDNNDADWEPNNGVTWAAIPGYAFRFTKHATLYAGVSIGQDSGDFALSPEVGSVISF
jgi:hypothetical protein